MTSGVILSGTWTEDNQRYYIDTHTYIHDTATDEDGNVYQRKT